MTEYLDPTGRGYITQEEVKSFSLEQLKELVLFVDPNDVSNTEDFEYSHINGDDIRYSGLLPQTLPCDQSLKIYDQLLTHFII